MSNRSIYSCRVGSRYFSDKFYHSNDFIHKTFAWKTLCTLMTSDRERNKRSWKLNPERQWYLYKLAIYRVKIDNLRCLGNPFQLTLSHWSARTPSPSASWMKRLIGCCLIYLVYRLLFNHLWFDSTTDQTVWKFQTPGRIWVIRHYE